MGCARPGVAAPVDGVEVHRGPCGALTVGAALHMLTDPDVVSLRGTAIVLGPTFHRFLHGPHLEAAEDSTAGVGHDRIGRAVEGDD